MGEGDILYLYCNNYHETIALIFVVDNYFMNVWDKSQFSSFVYILLKINVTGDKRTLTMFH